MPSALLLPVLTCVVVLVVSGIAKLRAPETVGAAFTALDVPAVIDTPLVRRLLPWVEIAIGVCLLLATGATLVVVALLTLALFLAYLVLVARAARRPEPVECGCFGALGDSEVTTVTVWRNAALVLSAALAVLAGVNGSGALPSLIDDTGAWAWVAAATLTAAVAALVVHRPPGTPLDDPQPSDALAGADGEYVGGPAPAAQVLTEEGEVLLLSHEALKAAHLLVFLSPGCSRCAGILPLVPAWSEALAPVTVRAVLTAPASVLDSHAPGLRGLAWFDPFSITRKAFGVGTPSAVLLGTDGQIAGGPVIGDDAVREFVAEVADHLREAQLSSAGQ